MCWKNINFAEKRWYIPDIRNSVILLADTVIKILERRKQQSNSKWVFPSDSSSSGHLVEPKNAWKRVCKRAGIQGLRINDLRKTCISQLTPIKPNKFLANVIAHDPKAAELVNLEPTRELIEKTINSMMSIK